MADPGSTLLGGGLTVVGGFLGALLLRWLDRQAVERRAEQEYHAAAALVSDELAANIETLKVTLGHDPDSIPELENAVYRDRQLILAQRLPPDVREALGAAYIYVQTPRVFRLRSRTIQSGFVGPPQEWDTPNLEHIKACYEKTVEAHRLLEPFGKRQAARLTRTPKR